MEEMDRKFAVLIVDDQVELAHNLGDILREEGYSTTVAYDGKTALDLSSSNIFDLTIVDILLPDISGVELVREMNQRGAHTDFIVITGHASLDSAIEVVAQQRTIAYEVKPLDIKRLLALVRQIAERRNAEVALQHSRARLRLLLDQVPCILWTAGPDLRLTSCVGTGFGNLNVIPDEIIGRPVDDRASGKRQLQTAQAHRKALSGIASTYELQARGRAFHCVVEPFRDVDGTISGVIGLAVDITERKITEDQLHMLTRRLVEVQESERRVVAGELHDQIGQYLTALKLLLHRTQKIVGENTPETLEQARSVLTELISRVRNLSLDLRPQMLDDLGLLPALLWHFDRYTEQTEVAVNFRHSGLREDIPTEVSTAAYRIVQEALNNVARYAETKEVSVTVWASHSALCLKIEDKGIGFDTAQVGVGAGIQGMRERAFFLGGSIELDSLPGHGTRVFAEFPLTNNSKATDRKQKRS